MRPILRVGGWVACAHSLLKVTFFSYIPSNLSENPVPASRRKNMDAHKDPSVAKVKAELERQLS